MNRKRILKILLVLVVAGLVVALFFRDQALFYLRYVLDFIQTWPFLLILIFAVAIFLIWIKPWLETRHVQLGLRDIFKKDKIYTIEKSEEAALEYVRKFGVEDRDKETQLFVYDQDPDPPTADVPFVTFLITTEKLEIDQLHKLENILEEKRWFVVVNRRNNEIINRFSTLHTWDEVDEFLQKKRLIGIPLRERSPETQMQRQIFEKMFGGFVEEKGRGAAREESGEKAESGGETVAPSGA